MGPDMSWLLQKEKDWFLQHLSWNYSSSRRPLFWDSSDISDYLQMCRLSIYYMSISFFHVFSTTALHFVQPLERLEAKDPAACGAALAAMPAPAGLPNRVVETCLVSSKRHKCWPLLTHFPNYWCWDATQKKIWYLLFWYRGRQILRADVAAAGISMRSQSIAKLGDTPNCRRVTPGITTIWRCPIQGGTPSYHPFLDWIFHEINQPAIGVPPWLWNLHMSNRQN